MSWTCPNCHRSFAKSHQIHSCGDHDLAHHFINREPWLQELYQKLILALQNIGQFRIEPAKEGIMLKRNATFAWIKIQKKCLVLSFTLDLEIDEFPVYKTLKRSKSRWGHAVKMDSEDQIDGQILGWIREAWNLQK